MELAERAGAYTQVDAGYRAYVPRDLPPVPPLSLEAGHWDDLSRAERSLARLDERLAFLKLPAEALRWLSLGESLASARLDGLHVRLAELLAAPSLDPFGKRDRQPADSSGGSGAGLSPAAASVLSAERAASELCRRARRTAPRTALLRALHAQQSGASARPRTWREDEVWIGPRGSTIHTARFVPPPPVLVPSAMEALDGYLGAPAEHAPLVRAALVYHQIETVQPLASGTGRANRMFSALLLARSGVAAAPLLPLSRFFLRDPGEYLGHLQRVREVGDWETWVGYFLRALAWAGERAAEDAQRLYDLGEHQRSMIRREMPGQVEPADRLLDFLLRRPVVSVGEVVTAVGRTFANANQLVARFEALEILTEITGGRRNRRYRYEGLAQLLRR